MSSSYRPVVAIAGLGGVLGQATLDALLSPQFASSFQLPIRVLMRDPSRFGGPVHPAGMVCTYICTYTCTELYSSIFVFLDY